MQATNKEKLRVFAVRLRSAAEKHNYTQTDIARRLGVSLPKVGNWFQGKNFPKRDAEPLARLLGVPVEFLLYGAVPVQKKEISLPVFSKEEEVPAVGSTDALTAEFRSLVEELLEAAKGDPKRLGWIIEQMKEHVSIPKNWRTNEELNRRAYAEVKRRREELERAGLARQIPEPRTEPPALAS